MDEDNARLDREKAALADLLAAKKKEYDQMRQHYRDRVGDLEEEVQRLKSEKLRLVDKLQLPESERASLVAQVRRLNYTRPVSSGVWWLRRRTGDSVVASSSPGHRTVE